MATYNVLIDRSFITEVRQSIADPDFGTVMEEQIINDSRDALDFVCMISAEEVEMRYVRRCTIRLAAYIAYKSYTTMAEKKLSTLPESAPILLQNLLMQAFNCLSYISQVPLNSDLSVNLNALGTPIDSMMSPSLIEPASL